ncbi:MAG: type II and III secretion system protein [Spirochaetia bacterium]|nr:type II and III secretion system protein [Spirochaetia bacterium]
MKNISIFCLLSFLLLSVFVSPALCREIRVTEGTSRVLRVENVKSIEVLKKETAFATIISDDEVLVDAKKQGTAVINITTEKGVESVIVTVKKKNSGAAMIELNVQILEVCRSDTGDMGIDWPVLLGGPLPDGGLPLSPLNLIEDTPLPLKALGATFNRGRINLLVDFLVKKNYAKLLAKPKLLAADGESARFQSGGEVPLVTVNAQGQASVDWKKYGVMLEIKPRMEKDGMIRAEIKAEVSNLDYVNAVNFGTSIMPAVKTRWAETKIVVEPDSTMVIAGLIENEEIKVTDGVPVLSGIPLLGELFKSTHTETKKTELVIFVTPGVAGLDGEL